MKQATFSLGEGIQLVLMGAALGIGISIFVRHQRNLPPNTVEARESSAPATTNVYLVAFVVMGENGRWITGDITFAAAENRLKTQADLDALRAYVVQQLEGREPKPVAEPTILNIVKL